MSSKSPTAFRTISEVSEELEIPQHVLRFWETRFAQVKPLKRAGGRRYYRPEDVDLLRRIREALVPLAPAQTHPRIATVKPAEKSSPDRRTPELFSRPPSAF